MPTSSNGPWPCSAKPDLGVLPPTTGSRLPDRRGPDHPSRRPRRPAAGEGEGTPDRAAGNWSAAARGANANSRPATPPRPRRDRTRAHRARGRSGSPGRRGPARTPGRCLRRGRLARTADAAADTGVNVRSLLRSRRPPCRAACLTCSPRRASARSSQDRGPAPTARRDPIARPPGVRCAGRTRRSGDARRRPVCAIADEQRAEQTAAAERWLLLKAFESSPRPDGPTCVLGASCPTGRQLAQAKARGTARPRPGRPPEAPRGEGLAGHRGDGRGAVPGASGRKPTGDRPTAATSDPTRRVTDDGGTRGVVVHAEPLPRLVRAVVERGVRPRAKRSWWRTTWSNQPHRARFAWRHAAALHRQPAGRRPESQPDACHQHRPRRNLLTLDGRARLRPGDGPRRHGAGHRARARPWRGGAGGAQRAPHRPHRPWADSA